MKIEALFLGSPVKIANRELVSIYAHGPAGCDMTFEAGIVTIRHKKEAPVCVFSTNIKSFRPLIEEPKKAKNASKPE